MLRWTREQHTRQAMERLAAEHGVQPGSQLPPEVQQALQIKGQADR